MVKKGYYVSAKNDEDNAKNFELFIDDLSNIKIYFNKQQYILGMVSSQRYQQNCPMTNRGAVREVSGSSIPSVIYFYLAIFSYFTLEKLIALKHYA